MTSRRQRWARLWSRVWQPPRAHGEQPRDRVVGPLELFYDLVVVALVAQTAHGLSQQPTWRGLGEFATVFTLIWIAWLSGSLHHELHGREDARGRSTFLLQILVLVPLGASIPHAAGDSGAAFAVSAAALFALLAALWWLAGRRDSPEFHRASWLFDACTAACAVVLLVSAAMPADTRMLAWAALDVAYLAAFAVALCLAPSGSVTLVTTHALIERFGLLIIIVLGETVTGVVTGLAEHPLDTLTLAVGLVAVLVGFGAWWTYFDFAGHRPPRPGRGTTLLWIYAHLPLTAAITVIGAAMVRIVEHAHDAHTPTSTAWMLCAGTAVTLCTTTVIASTLQDWRTRPGFHRPVAAACVSIAVAALALGYAQPAPLLLVVALVALYSIPWLLAVTLLQRPPATAI
ncbi:low temperature requirement protein A [Rhodococcus olei]|uniref:Low temperature requirement protein A n=1 Tax=Rhodococcus olei TaxID=2161675 RepID=A0ABP8PR15_9NOCA